MKSNFDMVADFMKGFGQRIKTEPEWPDHKLLGLRLRLIDEEMGELIDAVNNESMVDVADALSDLLYVVYGMGHAMGIDLDKCFQEVHRSNMTKFGSDGKVITREDGKIIKSKNFDPPNLEKILFPED